MVEEEVSRGVSRGSYGGRSGRRLGPIIVHFLKCFAVDPSLRPFSSVSPPQFSSQKSSKLKPVRDQWGV